VAEPEKISRGELSPLPGASILCRILSDLIESDDPTKSYRIPGDGFTPDSVRQIYQMFQIFRAVVLAILENTLFDASDPTIGLIDLGSSSSFKAENKYTLPF
jgi:hypothetical protein